MNFYDRKTSIWPYPTLLDEYNRSKIQHNRQLLIDYLNNCGGYDALMISERMTVSLGRKSFYGLMTCEEHNISSDVHYPTTNSTTRYCLSYRKSYYIDKFKYIPLGKLHVNTFKGFDILKYRWNKELI